jgi:protein O-GlcNAc transferase
MTTASITASPPRRVSSLLEDARRMLNHYVDNPGDAAAWADLLDFRRLAAGSIAALPPGQKTGAEVEAVEALLNLFAKYGAADHAPSENDLALATSYATKNWPGLLAAMLLAPAWEWDSPAYNDVPTWMWPAYTVYVFHTPQGFSSCGQAEKFAAHHLRRLEELAHWGSVNRGAAAVRLSLENYVRRSNCIPLYFSNESLKKHYVARARVLSLALNVPAQADLMPLPRDGRRLRIGFINRHFSPQTETYTTLPTFEHLDAERFEVMLFAHGESGTPLEQYARSRAASFQILSESVDGQVQQLLAANLDVAVFGTNVTAVPNEVLRLALHRVAPLQVVNNSSCTTSGLPEIDLYVSGDLTESAEAPSHFSERLGLLSGPAHAFNYTADQQEPGDAWTRAALGVPDDAVLFVTAANYFKVIPEVQHTWARLLKAVPGSRLLVHPFNPNWSSSYPIKRFCAEFDRVLSEHGVSGDRLVISTNKFPSRADVKELLRVGDIYLDTFPFGGVNSLVDPLECGIPVITREGQTFRSRMGAAVLRALQLDEFVATDEASYLKLAADLATDAARRTAVRERVAKAMERAPIFLDTLAASDGFGALMEAAYDELLAEGRAAFRAKQTPLKAPAVSDVVTFLSEAEIALASGQPQHAAALARRVLDSQPASANARHVYGRALLALGRADRAAAYLLEAVQHIEGNATLWCDLAAALKQNNQMKQAVESVQVCLSLDPRNLEALLLLSDIAEISGQMADLADVLKLAQEIAPLDPRVVLLSQKFQATQPV